MLATHTTSRNFENSLNQRSARTDTPRVACTPVSTGTATGSSPGTRVRTSMIKPTMVKPDLARDPSQVDEFKFLMVDDDSVNRLIMTQKLTMAKELASLSAVCDEAEHGEAALQKLHANGGTQYDVLIFDEHMEGSGGKLKGSEVIRKLRREGCKSVIVSCSVSCNESSNVGEFRSAGADICWAKPFPSPKQMYIDLSRVLHSQRLPLRAASPPISPDPPRSFPMERGHKVQQFGNMLRLSTPPAPPTDLDENELAGHQPHWHCPSPSMLPSIVPDAAHVLTIHVSPSSTTGVKRTWTTTLDDAPPAGTVASLSTPLEKMAKQQTPGAPDSLSGGFELLASVDSSTLAHLHGLFMAI
jgi:CheY-like chemotaxis protein